jgi:hypothetical protein
LPKPVYIEFAGTGRRRRRRKKKEMEEKSIIYSFKICRKNGKITNIWIISGFVKQEEMNMFAVYCRAFGLRFCVLANKSLKYEKAVYMVTGLIKSIF